MKRDGLVDAFVLKKGERMVVQLKSLRRRGKLKIMVSNN